MRKQPETVCKVFVYQQQMQQHLLTLISYTQINLGTKFQLNLVLYVGVKTHILVFLFFILNDIFYFKMNLI